MENKILKRLEKEASENKNPSHCFHIQPLKSDIYTWHFTLIGLKDSVYKNGIYHGYIKLPKDYPLNPPDFYFFNRNGRYEINTKICLNISSYHKESWTPAWGLRTMMEAISAYFFVEGEGIGALRDSAAKRKTYAKSSREYVCEHCGDVKKIESFIESFHNTPKVIDNKKEKKDVEVNAEIQRNKKISKRKENTKKNKK